MLLALRVVLWRPLAVTGAAPNDGYVRVAGALHVHTTLSDGSGAPEEVAAAAKRADLKFVVITDHNNLNAKPFEGYHDGVLVIVGTEVSTAAGHVLGLGIADPVFRFSGDPQDALDDIRLLGGSAYAAHPLSARPDFVWSGWNLPGPWGMELLNGDSQWRAAGFWRLARTAGLYALNPSYALLGSLTSPRATLARWDGLLARRDTPGIAGADAHNRVPLHKRFQPRFPSYESIFALAKNHVLLEAPLRGDAAADTAAILGALARGRSYVGLDALAPADGFSFRAESPSQKAAMGETIAPREGLFLRASGALPAGARLTLVRDGQALVAKEGPLEVAPSSPGAYRVEVSLPGWDVPWILSNPIYVFDAAAAAARAKAAAWPEPAAAPPAVEALDSFDATSSFSAEADSSSHVAPEFRTPGAGPSGESLARLAFRLGQPGPDHPFVSCALVSRTPRDLSGHLGLVFAIRGDRVYRIWVQVRDANPASADGGTEWWGASVRTALEWRRVAVPFASLRSINPKTDGQLDLDKVKELVFVLDQGAVKPGTEGTIELAGLGAY